jgi:hypothetical protein
MKTVAQIIALCLGLTLPIAAQAGAVAKADPPKVQIALLLDTSGSMSGLIDQAKTELWSVVNEFALAERGGVRPEVEVALYQYGTPSLGAEGGYIKQLVPLTQDLDKVSEELFALTTSGGDEYCGWVIQRAFDELAWSPESNDYKAIFIAGNEGFAQGSVDYRQSVKAAISKGIIVNTIHCGDNQSGISDQWDQGAKLADGRFLNIDHNAAVVAIAAPQDDEITRLGMELNKTYIAYGSSGGESRKRQAKQEENAMAAGAPSMVERQVTKASGNYRADSWDLVDAAESEEFDMDEVPAEQLPEEMRGMNDKQREAYIAKKAEEREKIQAEINALAAERKEFIAAEMAKLADGDETLGAVMKAAVREQAEKREFTFED